MTSETDDRRFSDRRAAGWVLAEVLADREWQDPVVLGLPRGGVPVGYEIARALRAPLGVQVVRKIGLPGRPEFGVGAVTAKDPPSYDDQTLRRLGLGPEDLRADCERERAEARRRTELYQGDRVPPRVEQRDVVVCDDGLATGVTARAALRHVRGRRPRTLVFAAPVCARHAADRLLREADHVHCLARPHHFGAVGLYYSDFRQTTDGDVLALLEAADQELVAGR